MNPTVVPEVLPKVQAGPGPSKRWWRAAVPVAITVVFALLPPPAGLEQHAWYYFALFAGVIAALVTEPLPNPAVGLVGLTLAAALSRWVLYSPVDLAKPGFNVVSQSINWALSGFASTTVWLVGAAFMFALGYEKTGLGRRIALLLVRVLGRRTLTLGYATTFADAILAPVTPSNTARGAGILYPIVQNLPGLYDSRPQDRRLHHVDHLRRGLHHIDAVHDRLRAELPGARLHQPHRAHLDQLRRLDARVRALRVAAAAPGAAADLLNLPAADQAQPGGIGLGA